MKRRLRRTAHTPIAQRYMRRSIHIAYKHKCQTNITRIFCYYLHHSKFSHMNFRFSLWFLHLYNNIFCSSLCRFTIYKVHKASKKKREKSSAKKERKATKTLAIVLGKCGKWVNFSSMNIVQLQNSLVSIRCCGGWVTMPTKGLNEHERT